MSAAQFIFILMIWIPLWGCGGGSSSSASGNAPSGNSGTGETGGAGQTDGGGTSGGGTGGGSVTTGSAYPEAAQDCVQLINQYRATLGLPSYQRWTEIEPCADGEAKKDADANTAHSSFGSCGEWAQNTCPGWSGTPETMIGSCLQMMWDEGPGDFSSHGHYINMSSTTYTKAACGFYVTADGKVWTVQDFR